MTSKPKRHRSSSKQRSLSSSGYKAPAIDQSSLRSPNPRRHVLNVRRLKALALQLKESICIDHRTLHNLFGLMSRSRSRKASPRPSVSGQSAEGDREVGELETLFKLGNGCHHGSGFDCSSLQVVFAKLFSCSRLVHHAGEGAGCCHGFEGVPADLRAQRG